MKVCFYFLLIYDSELTTTTQVTGKWHLPKQFLNEFTFLVTIFYQAYSRQAIFWLSPVTFDMSSIWLRQSYGVRDMSPLLLNGDMPIYSI